MALAPRTQLPGASSPSLPPGVFRPGASGVASSPSRSTAPPANGASQQIDGDVIGTRYGGIQVRVVESAGKITDVQALQLPFDRNRSREISQFAEPILRSEALQAQNAQIDTVSGATYTSDAYSASLQSAIDRAHG
jgi:uncharacterized protein with FMN-binding domain